MLCVEHDYSNQIQAKLKALHEVVVRNRLEQLRKRQRDEALQAQVELLGTAAQPNTKQWPTEVQVPQSEAMEVDQGDVEVEPYTRDMSPPVVEIAKLPYEERQFPVVNPEAELEALVSIQSTFHSMPILIRLQIAQRRSIAATRFVAKPTQQEEPEAPTEAPAVADAFTTEMNNRMDAEADLDEDDEEELFNTEAALAQPTTYTWEDKYRPRKPRYLNRVHTGYEWNKYNQTHYEYVPRTALIRPANKFL